MRGIGTITKIQKYRNSMMTILGDDGVEYFSHKMRLVDIKKWKYCYNGNRCTFDIVDEGKEHLAANNVRPEEIPDPMNPIKRERIREEKERIAVRDAKKAESIARQTKLKERADLRRAYEAEHLKYVVQEYVESVWVNLDILDDLESARNVLRPLKENSDGAKFRIKKYMVHVIGGKTIFKDIK